MKNMPGQGRKPKSRALRVLSGQLPITKEAVAEINETFVPPAIPPHLNERERVVWDETLRLLQPLRVLKNIDSAVLGAYCASYVRWQDAECEIRKEPSVLSGLCLFGKDGNVHSIHPLVIISRDAKKDMVAYASQLAMTPAARLKMVSGVSKVVEKNPFMALKAQRK